jgi:hypothetical protein
VLLYDFDSGNAANDTFDLIAEITDLRQGSDEVMTAPGDSGGPTLINGQVAGITSFAATVGTGDSVARLNSSFGEIGGDTRVSVFASWIDSIIPPTVINVIISSSVSTTYSNPAYEFDSIVGSEEQLRTVDVGAPNQISIQFSEDVDIASG